MRGASPPLAVAVLAALAVAACVPLLPEAEVVARSGDGALVVHGAREHVERTVPDATRLAAVAPVARAPVVLLHGYGASSHAWRDVVPALAAARRVVAVDLHGFGWGERPRDLRAYTAAAQVALVVGVLDRLGIEDAHVVGHSYGGAIAMQLAVRHPERVRSLALVASAAPDYPQARRRPVLGSRVVAPFLVRGLLLRPSNVRRRLETSIADDRLVTPALVDAYFDRLRVPGVVRAFRGLVRPIDEPPAGVVLSELALPVLVVWGEDDAVIPIADGLAAARLVPGVRIATLPGVGHLPMEEAPDRLATTLATFLADLERPAAPPRVAGGRPPS